MLKVIHLKTWGKISRRHWAYYSGNNLANWSRPRVKLSSESHLGQSNNLNGMVYVKWWHQLCRNTTNTYSWYTTLTRLRVSRLRQKHKHRLRLYFHSHGPEVLIVVIVFGVISHPLFSPTMFCFFTPHLCNFANSNLADETPSLENWDSCFTSCIPSKTRLRRIKTKRSEEKTLCTKRNLHLVHCESGKVI